MEKIYSLFREMYHPCKIEFPNFTGTRIMMMPVILGDLTGVPDKYRNIVQKLYEMTEYRFIKNKEIGYLTIDERQLKKGETLRRSGIHVDGFFNGKCGAWGGGGSWGSVGNGMLTISSTSHCKVWVGIAEGYIGSEGEADKLKLPDCKIILKAGHVYWLDGSCIHESMNVEEDIKRQFVRLSMPSNGPWFDGYTKNPDPNILPAGDILPIRQFM